MVAGFGRTPAKRTQLVYPLQRPAIGDAQRAEVESTSAWRADFRSSNVFACLRNFCRSRFAASAASFSLSTCRSRCISSALACAARRKSANALSRSSVPSPAFDDEQSWSTRKETGDSRVLPGRQAARSASSGPRFLLGREARRVLGLGVDVIFLSDMRHRH
jgi:hypothetical protein